MFLSPLHLAPSLNVSCEPEEESLPSGWVQVVWIIWQHFIFKPGLFPTLLNFVVAK